MDINVYYPQEIVQRIHGLPPKEKALPRELRMIDILHDEDVAKKAQYVLERLVERKTEEDLAHVFDEFWNFIEFAADLPDIRPPGARWHARSEAAFFTPADVRSELIDLRDAGQKFSKLLIQRSDLVLFDRLDELLQLINAFITHPQIKSAEDKVLPNHGKAAGKNSWRNHLLRQLSVAAQVRLGDKYPAFIAEVHRVLMGAADSLDPSTVREIIGPVTSLVDSL